MAESSSGMKTWACVYPSCHMQMELPVQAIMNICPLCRRDQAAYIPEQDNARTLSDPQSGQTENGRVVGQLQPTNLDPLRSDPNEVIEEENPSSRGAVGLQTNIPLRGPQCQYCPATLLTPDAKLCDSCGRPQQKGLRSSNNEHPPNVGHNSSQSTNPPTTQWSTPGQPLPPTATQLGTHGQIPRPPPPATQRGTRGQPLPPTATQLGTHGQQPRPPPPATQRGTRGQPPPPPATRLGTRSQPPPSTATQLGTRGQPPPPPATQWSTQSRGQPPPRPAKPYPRATEWSVQGQQPPPPAKPSPPSATQRQNQLKPKSEKIHPAGKQGEGSGSQSLAMPSTSPTGLPQGFRVSERDSINVIFHVIVPLDIWEWDETSQICLRFGHPDLGGWGFNCGLGHFKERPIEQGISEMTWQFRIPMKFLQKAIPYKYMILSPKKSDQNDWYEVIPTTYRNNPNRALYISEKKIAKCQGVYHQYDAFIYPKVSRSWGAAIKNMVGFGDDSNTLEMRKQALIIYLDCKNSLSMTGTSGPGRLIMSLVDDIEHIFNSLLKCLIFHEHAHNHTDDGKHRDFEAPLKQTMKDWCVSAILKLEQRPPSGQKLASALCITCLINSLGFKLSDMSLTNVCLPLARMLCLQPVTDTIPMQCVEFDYICELLPGNDDREKAADSIKELLKHLSNEKKNQQFDWLFALSMYNLLKLGTSSKFGDVTLFKSDQLFRRWTDIFRDFNLSEIRKATFNSSIPLVLAHYKELEPLFILDPLLLQVVTSICPKDELGTLFSRIPPNVSMAWLSMSPMSSPLRRNYQDEAGHWAIWMNVIVGVIKEKKTCKEAELFAMLDCSRILLSKCTTQLSSPDDQCVKIVKAALGLALVTIAYFETHYPDSKGQNKKDCIDRALQDLDLNLRIWFEKNEVIGKIMFGGHTHERTLRISKLSKDKQEIEIWRNLLTVKCPSPAIKTAWLNLNKEFLKERVHAVPDELKLDLLAQMKGDSEDHEVLTSVMFDAAMRIVDLVFSESSESTRQRFEKLAKHQSRSMGKVLGTVITRKYPRFGSTHEQSEKDTPLYVTLTELLEWYLWPDFIQVFGSTSVLKKGMPEESQAACLCALSKFNEVCDSLKTGDITVGDLWMIAGNRDRMQRLCRAVTSSGSKEGNSYDSLNILLQARLIEFRTFQDYKTMHLKICNWIPSQHCFIGLDELKQELDRDYSGHRIKDLCGEEDGKIEVKCFKAASPLNEFSQQFQIMMTKRSNLFVRPLEKKLKSVIASNSETEVSISDIFSLVWKPTFEHCVTLLESLADLTIKLAAVDKYLKEFSETLDTQVKILSDGISECTKKAGDPTRLNLALIRVQNYWKLCEYRHGADVFLRLRDVLELQRGDFSDVERFSTEFATSMTDQTLADIDDSLVQTGRFLENVANHPYKKNCLEKFVECQKVIKWLKSTTKDVSEIQGFVTVALATAAGGEDDLTHDRLSHLRTVGSGFAAFIYNIKEGDGYKQLEDKCSSLWEALENNPDLPKLLDECNKDLSWYQSVRDTQASVETTSYGQMRNILKYGCYRVGATSSVAKIDSIHDLISMRLEDPEQEDVQLHKKEYTLDELRDLESKLVLICGNKAESKSEVNHFLMIAEVFLDLQRDGNVEHSRSVVIFKRCALYDEVPGSEKEKELVLNTKAGEELNSLLQSQAKDMENILKEWEGKVKEARLQYYHLNCYTTLQLLALRKELGPFKVKISTSVPSSVLVLLQSVSSEVDNSLVKDAVLRATAADSPANTPVIETEQSPSDSKNLPEISLLKDKPKSSDRPSQEDTAKPLKPRGPNHPSLTAEDLNDDQQSVLTHCVEFQGFTELHVLRAFETCGLEANRFDIEEWCDDNKDIFAGVDSQESELGSEDEEDESSSDDSSGESDIEESVHAPGNRPSASSGAVSKQKQEKLRVPLAIKVVTRQTIDICHPDVQKLIDADFEVEQSIDAIERFGELGAAMDFLENGGASEEQELFQSAIDQNKSNTLTGIEYDDAGDPSTPRLIFDPDVVNRYLSLDELGNVLEILGDSSTALLSTPRTFDTALLKSGLPNLLVTASETVLRTVLALYMEDDSLPLPSHEEVLICNSGTNAEEVILLWRRAIFDPGFKRIFCLAHAEKLSYQVCDTALRALSEFSQGKTGYRLVIVCSKEESDTSPIISRLHLHKRLTVPTFKVDEYKEYLMSHFVHNEEDASSSEMYASSVDSRKSCVRVVSSSRSGMGKSLYIQRMTDTLKEKLSSSEDVHVTVPIHGPVITADMLLDLFENSLDKDLCTIYHIDIAPSILASVDTILFSLLILRGLSDSKGRVWRCHPRQLYAAEVTANLSDPDQGMAIQNQVLGILKLLPAVECSSPLLTFRNKQAEDSNSKCVIGMDNVEFEGSTVQRVYQYLRRHSSGANLDNFDTSISLSVEGNVTDYLEVVLKKCDIKDPTWSEVHHFNKFLDTQLISCEKSAFCAAGIMPGLKSFAVKFMIRMSQDFSTPSLEVEVEEDETDDSNRDLAKYKIAEKRQWTESSHPYIFFNRDGNSITFVGVRVTEKNRDLIDFKNNTVIEPSVMQKSLYDTLSTNGVKFDEDYQKMSKNDMIKKITRVMGIFSDTPKDPDVTYVLTADNLIKILAIQMRFRCDIPVVLMGETGCGKTRLIRYMCDLARQGADSPNMLIMKIHGGITDKDVTNFVLRAETIAEENKEESSEMDTVVFFDEANTTDSIGLIKEIMCDRRLNGRPISKDLKFIAACNPYRRHNKDMIKKLETAGLGFYVRATETQQKLGKIPLRQLVYRVLDLPPSMRPLVYDFGELKTGTEHDYTSQIVKDHVKNHETLKLEDPHIIPVIARVLAASQEYMRNKEDECSFVSLRDVERTMIMFEYFYERMDKFAPLMNAKAMEGIWKDEETSQEEAKDEEAPKKAEVQHPSDITRALILAVSISYHARLNNRTDYEETISAEFKDPLILPRGAEQFRDEIKWCQEALLDNMRLGPNIAKNAALRENVFMMAICIELRIPLFLVGKPGSSKSLAKSIIHDSMLGPDSQTELLRSFKQVHMFSYQCSQLSTPRSVIEVFKTAEKFQAKQDTDTYVSVVVLDEVGLAEDSPNLPLKALHPLLEDGTEGAGKNYQQRTVERNKRVAFIGISNWALDPAKMNRGVMVTRGDPGLEELKLSARGICSNKVNDPIRERLQDYFDPLSRAYVEVCMKQNRQFFGLRDFYSLIKMLYWMCAKSEGHPLSGPQLEHAIKRNFGGLESESVDPIEVFKKAIDFTDSRHWYDFTGLPEEILEVVNPDCSRLGLIKTSLSTKENSWHGENRYLLFLTENYAALDILEHYLEVGSGSSSQTEENTSDVEDEISSKPFTLFGSSFPKDKDYTQVCRNINQIKICMETGRTVILLNLENLYESLYDVLNQYYMYYGNVRYVDLGLQTHRVKCRVHENFKLILIAEKSTVYEKFPTPLINRLEKHFVLTSTVLEEWQKKVLEDFQKWIYQFSSPRETTGKAKHFEEGHAFIGYQKDTPAAVIFQASNQLKKLVASEGGDSTPAWERLQKIGVLKDITTKDLSKADESSDSWKDAVMRLSQYLLLQTASEDALFRLKQSKLLDEEVKYLMNLYYQGQEHKSIVDFIKYSFKQKQDGCHDELFMQVTTHSHLLTEEELEKLPQAVSVNTTHFDLLEFDTELDFSNKIGPLFHRADDALDSTSLIIIQCDSGHQNSDLIACARYRIYDEALRARHRNKIQKQVLGSTHVMFIIRLPQQEVRSKFVGFQSDPWISVHIDDLKLSSQQTVSPEQAISAAISELFIGRFDRERKDIETISNIKPSLENSVQCTESDETGDSQSQESTEKVDNDEENGSEEISSGSIQETKIDSASTVTKESILKEEHGDAETEKHFDFYPQHHRLYGCIQSAVSALRDSGKDRTKPRLQKLMCLVPREPTASVEDTTFYGLLVRMMYNALKEREKARIDEQDWVVMEAMNARKLQSGGTFRNVLTRRIDEVITPYFAEIIAAIDQTSNLDLLEDPRKGDSSLTRFWLSMFSQVDIEFSSHVQGKAHIIIETEFHSKLPFSLMVKYGIDAQLANTSADADLRATHAQVCESLSQTFLGESLGSVPEEDCEELYKHYLYDFVRYVHKSKHKEKSRDTEHMLIADALNGMVHAPELCSVDGHESLTRRVTALHMVYNQCRSRILWFGELVLQNPGILSSLQNTNLSKRSDTDFNLHLLALDKIVSHLQSPLAKDKPAANLSRWLNDVRLSQNLIDSILSLSSENDTATKLSLAWQRIRAVQMFVEHVFLPYSEVKEVLKYVRRLDTRLSANSDFLKKETLESVKKQVNNMVSNLPKMDKTKKSSIKKSCHNFFMEVVSSLCFGGSQVPESELLKSLVDTIVCDGQTRELTPYGTDTKADKIPTIRSFVLQLLLEHSPQQVKEYLDDYFKRSTDLFKDGSVNQGLCLLCIQCFEDALYKEVSLLSPEDQVHHAIEAAHESYSTLKESVSRPREVSLDYLEAVAKARYILSVVADSLEAGHINEELLTTVKEMCTDENINTVDVTGDSDMSGPVVYLLKLLVRRYGFPCLTKVCETHSWVVPTQLKGDERTIDSFVLYQEQYVKFRTTVFGVLTENGEKINNCELKAPTDPALLALVLYQEATLTQGSAVRLKPEPVEVLNEFISNNEKLSADMKTVSKLLLVNQQGGPLAQMTVSPHLSPLINTLRPIVVHTVAVVLCQQKIDILLPFVNILRNPAALQKSYLPTIPEDVLSELMRATDGLNRSTFGTFYQCRNGHPYLVGGTGGGGSCPAPTQQGTCTVCGIPIGGDNIAELEKGGSTSARKHDTTKTGHDLGDPANRHTPNGVDRYLSAPAVCIVRAIMHSAFIWAACNNEAMIETLAQLVSPPVAPSDLPEFYWRHLERDVQDLSEITSRGIDECAMIIHLVLGDILSKSPPASVGNAKTLETRDTRTEWQRLFNQAYIEPVLGSLEKRLKKAMDLVAYDDKQEHNPLFFLAYERVKVDEKRLEPHLWTFRSRVDVNHLRGYLQQQRNKDVKVLSGFLNEELDLRATQYLPDIVKLQHFLFNTFHRKMKKSDAKIKTIREFLGEIKNENTRNEYRERIESLKKAWALVGHKLKHHKRLPVEDEHFQPAITDDTDLVYLIPTTTGEGRCTTALVDFLVLTHNSFVEMCRGMVKDDPSSAIWVDFKVPITHINRCHLLDFEQHLQSIILSHCHYSLTVGKGQDIKYDLPALEKHILNRFIYGKPMIHLGIPNVAYRQDLYSTDTFLAVRQKVKPQVAIPQRIQQDIITELRTPDRLRESLDVVDIVLGFLSSGGGNPSVTLKKYIDTHKMKKVPFSAKAKEFCTLGHIISLWETISVELARQLWQIKQEPFENVPENYLRELSAEEVTELNKCLRTFDLCLLLGSLFEFIEVHVKHITAKEEDWPIVDSMEFYRDSTEQDQLSQFAEEFPGSITVDQAVATWKHIVNFQENIERDS